MPSTIGTSFFLRYMALQYLDLMEPPMGREKELLCMGLSERWTGNEVDAHVARIRWYMESMSVISHQPTKALITCSVLTSTRQHLDNLCIQTAKSFAKPPRQVLTSNVQPPVHAPIVASRTVHDPPLIPTASTALQSNSSWR